MRFSRVFAVVAAAFSMTSVLAAVPQTNSGLVARQAVVVSACGTIGPIDSSRIAPALYPRINLLPVSASFIY